jgi:hypothetical protein
MLISSSTALPPKLRTGRMQVDLRPDDLRRLIRGFEQQVYDLVTVAMAAEYGLEYPDDNPLIDELASYERQYGELPKGPTPDEVREIFTGAIAKFRACLPNPDGGE